MVYRSTRSDGSIDRAALSKALGGVDVSKGEIVAIEQIIPADAVQLPRGSLDGSFIGDWCPGGKTSGGATEGLVAKVVLDRNAITTNGNSLTQPTKNGVINITCISGGLDGNGLVDGLYK